MGLRAHHRQETPEALLRRYRRDGSPAAIGALFDQVAPELFRLALALCLDAAAAEDALQETFLAALECAQQHDAQRAVMPWLIGILRNKVKQSRRRAARRPDAARLRPPLYI